MIVFEGFIPGTLIPVLTDTDKPQDGAYVTNRKETPIPPEVILQIEAGIRAMQQEPN